MAGVREVSDFFATYPRPDDVDRYAATLGRPQTDAFTFTVSWRGLFESPDRLALTHPYPELKLPAVEVPVLNLTEQVAEKIVGWCMHGLIKHYVDLAWIFDRLPDQVAVRNRLLPALFDRPAEARE
jgi:hypothetical protein